MDWYTPFFSLLSLVGGVLIGFALGVMAAETQK